MGLKTNYIYSDQGYLYFFASGSATVAGTSRTGSLSGSATYALAFTSSMTDSDLAECQNIKHFYSGEANIGAVSFYFQSASHGLKPVSTGARRYLRIPVDETVSVQTLNSRAYGLITASRQLFGRKISCSLASDSRSFSVHNLIGGQCAVPTQSSGLNFSITNVNTGSGVVGQQYYPGLIDIPTAYASFQLDRNDNNSFIISGSGNNKFYMSSSGLMGINTEDPKRVWDVLDESSGSAEFAIKKRAPDDAIKGSEESWLTGRDIGRLLFVADSGSYLSETSGAAAEIKAVVGNIESDGRITGHMQLNTWRSTGDEPLQIVTIGYGAGGAVGLNGVHFDACISQSGNNADYADFTNIRGSFTKQADRHVNYGTGASLATAIGTGSGDIIKDGNDTTVAGKIYYSNNGTWTLTDADAAASSTGLIAVALGTNSTTHGMLLRGMIKLHTDPGGNIGVPVYLADSSTGDGLATSTAPASGHIVRIIGYNVGTSGEIYFNPDHTWVERS